MIALVLRQSPEQIAGDAVLAETLRGLAAAARSGGFRVMVEPLAPDGPDATYAALLRAQHADGLVISGPRVDDPDLIELVRDGFPIVLQGALPGRGRDQRRRRQRRRRPGRGRAPHRPRPPTDRLHHQRAAGLHRGAGTPDRLSRGSSRGGDRRPGRAGRRGRLRRRQRPRRDGGTPRPDHLRCRLRGQRRRRPWGDRRPARGRPPRPRRTSRSSASTISRSPPTSTHPSPPSGCRPSSSGRPPDERCWTGSPIGRFPARTLLSTELIVRASTAPPSRASATGAG